MGYPKIAYQMRTWLGCICCMSLLKTCSYIPSTEGSVQLQTTDAKECCVEELPDSSKRDALKVFDINTTQFQCIPKCCWMLFEDLSVTGLTWVPNITCQGPVVLSSMNISDISTLQARCFESKSLHQIYVISISDDVRPHPHHHPHTPTPTIQH